MRAIWKGALTFGLVNVPVKVYSATEDHDVPLHQVHNKDGGRIRYQRICEIDGEVVPYRRHRQGVRRRRTHGRAHQGGPRLAARREEPRDRRRRVRAERAGRPADARPRVLPRARLRLAEGLRAAAQDARADRPHGDRAVLAAPEDPARGPARARRRARAADAAVGRRGARGGVPGARRAGADLGEGARDVGIPRRELRERTSTRRSSRTSTRTSCAPSSRRSSRRATRSTPPRRSASSEEEATAARSSTSWRRCARASSAAVRARSASRRMPRAAPQEPAAAKPTAAKSAAKKPARRSTTAKKAPAKKAAKAS